MAAKTLPGKLERSAFGTPDPPRLPAEVLPAGGRGRARHRPLAPHRRSGLVLRREPITGKVRAGTARYAKLVKDIGSQMD